MSYYIGNRGNALLGVGQVTEASHVSIQGSRDSGQLRQGCQRSGLTAEKVNLVSPKALFQPRGKEHYSRPGGVFWVRRPGCPHLVLTVL